MMRSTNVSLPACLGVKGVPMDAKPESMVDRFVRSVQINADNWRDPEYDLDAIRLATQEEKAAIESFLIQRGIKIYCDVEALSLFDTPSAHQLLLSAFRTGSQEVRAAVAQLVPELINADERMVELIDRIGKCDAYEGLSLTLTQIEETHPPAVVDAMLHRIVSSPGVVAVHFAGLLLYLHGQSAEPFDWEHRPFFLRFNPGDDADRKGAFAELCARINWDTAPYAAIWESTS